MLSDSFRAYVDRYLTSGVPLTPQARPSEQGFADFRRNELEEWRGFEGPGSFATVGGIECLRVEAEQVDKPRTVLYLHGGGYIYLSAQYCARSLESLSRICEAACICPNYRRAPEHPYPAPVEDAVACYRALLETGVRPEDIVIAGDSAGGGLVIAMLFAAATEGLPMPLCAIAFSPWTDLTTSGGSADEVDDPVVDGAGLRWMAECYLAGADPHDPLASPLFASGEMIRGLPPLMIQVGSREALLDDARRFAERAAGEGAHVEFVEHRDYVHMWLVDMPDVPETVRSFELVRDFVDRTAEAALRRVD